MKFSNKEMKIFAEKLHTNIKKLSSFTRIDPFNPQNIVSGIISKAETIGKLGGSCIFTHINSKKLKNEQLIYGTPKLIYPYVDFDDYKIINFKGCSKYYLMNKWNGMNILLYKYSDDNGNQFISAKSKGTPFIGNSQYGNFLNSTLESLGISNTGLKKSSTTSSSSSLYIDSNDFIIPKVDLFNKPSNKWVEKLANDKNIQSMSFELCGKKEPHLVKYDFDIELKPLFLQTINGDIEPLLTKDSTIQFGPFDYNQNKIEEEIKKITRK